MEMKLSQVLIELFCLGFQVTISNAKDIYNHACITITDTKTNKSYNSYIPQDSHMDYALAGNIDHCKKKLLELINS